MCMYKPRYEQFDNLPSLKICCKLSPDTHNFPNKSNRQFQHENITQMTLMTIKKIIIQISKATHNKMTY